MTLKSIAALYLLSLLTLLPAKNLVLSCDDINKFVSCYKSAAHVNYEYFIDPTRSAYNVNVTVRNPLAKPIGPGAPLPSPVPQCLHKCTRPVNNKTVSLEVNGLFCKWHYECDIDFFRIPLKIVSAKIDENNLINKFTDGTCQCMQVRVPHQVMSYKSINLTGRRRWIREIIPVTVGYSCVPIN